MWITFLILNPFARNVIGHGAIQLHDNIFLENIKDLHPAADFCIAAHSQSSRTDIFRKAWNSKNPVGDDIHRQIHPQGMPRLGLAGRNLSLTHHFPAIVYGRRAVAISKRRRVGVFHRNVGGEGDISKLTGSSSDGGEV